MPREMEGAEEVLRADVLQFALLLERAAAEAWRREAVAAAAALRAAQLMRQRQARRRWREAAIYSLLILLGVVILVFIAIVEIHMKGLRAAIAAAAADKDAGAEEARLRQRLVRLTQDVCISLVIFILVGIICVIKTWPRRRQQQVILKLIILLGVVIVVFVAIIAIRKEGLRAAIAAAAADKDAAAEEARLRQRLARLTQYETINLVICPLVLIIFMKKTGPLV